MNYGWNQCNKENIKAVDCGLDHSLCLTENGKIYEWKTKITKTPEIIEIMNDKIEQISAGAYHNAVLTRSNDIYCWGNNKYNQCIQSSVTMDNEEIDKPQLIINKILRNC